MNIWPELSYENYMKLYDNHNSFSHYENVKSVLLWGEGSQKNKQLSFFIPAYKRVDTLQETIGSILKQKRIIDYEIIICDNSADRSCDNEIYKYVERLNESSISLYVNDTNIGMAGNWNRAFEIPKTDLVALIHDDDLLSDDYLEYMAMAIKWAEKRGNWGFIRGEMKDYKETDGFDPIRRNQSNMHLAEIKPLDSLITGIGPTSCPTCGIVFNKSAAIYVGGFDERFYPSFDYILGYKMIRSGYRGYIADRELGYYRLGRNESTNIKVQIGFVMADFYFREYMYSHSIYSKIFGRIFREVQYNDSIKSLAEGCRKRFGSDITITEIDFRNRLGNYPIRWFLFRVLRKTIFFLKKKYKVTL